MGVSSIHSCWQKGEAHLDFSQESLCLGCFPINGKKITDVQKIAKHIPHEYLEISMKVLTFSLKW